MGHVAAIHLELPWIRAVVLDDRGDLRARATRQVAVRQRPPGGLEVDPGLVEAATRAVLDDLAGELAPPVAALGLAVGPGTAMAWDPGTGEVLHPLVVGSDPGGGARAMAAVVAGRGANARVGTIDTWLASRLGAGSGLATDPSVAADTGLVDLLSRSWALDELDRIGIPAGSLPPVLATTAPRGSVDTGWGRVALTAVVGRSQATLFGLGGRDPGSVGVHVGPLAHLLVNTGPSLPTPAGALSPTLAWELAGTQGGPCYALQAHSPGSMALDWLVELGAAASIEELTGRAEASTSTEGAVFVPAMTGLAGESGWDPGARGTMLGLARGVGAGHLARAGIEALAFGLRDSLLGLAAHRVEVRSMLVGGDLVDVDLVRSLMADLAGQPVTASGHGRWSAAVGAASLAGVGAQLWGPAAAPVSCQDPVLPRHRRSGVEGRHRQWTAAVERSRGWRPVTPDGD